jgi:hypothetical protein
MMMMMILIEDQRTIVLEPLRWHWVVLSSGFKHK